MCVRAIFTKHAQQKTLKLLPKEKDFWLRSLVVCQQRGSKDLQLYFSLNDDHPDMARAEEDPNIKPLPVQKLEVLHGIASLLNTEYQKPLKHSGYVGLNSHVVGTLPGYVEQITEAEARQIMLSSDDNQNYSVGETEEGKLVKVSKDFALEPFPFEATGIERALAPKDPAKRSRLLQKLGNAMWEEEAALKAREYDDNQDLLCEMTIPKDKIGKVLKFIRFSDEMHKEISDHINRNFGTALEI